MDVIENILKSMTNDNVCHSSSIHFGLTVGKTNILICNKKINLIQTALTLQELNYIAIRNMTL